MNNTPIQPQKSIKDFIPDFLEHLEIERGLSEYTQRNYHLSLKKFVSWLKENDLEDIKPHQLSPEHIWKYRVHLSRCKSDKTGDRLKKSTQNRHLVALRTFLKFFALRDIESLPADKVELPKDENERKVDFLNLDQIRELLSVPNTNKKIGLRDRAILEVLFSTGLKASNLVALNKDNINFDQNTKCAELKLNKDTIVQIPVKSAIWLRRYVKDPE